MKISSPTRRRIAGPAFLLVLASALLLPVTSGWASSPLFSDGFETGNMNAWAPTPPVNFQAQQAVVFQGAWAGRANVISQPGYASKTLVAPQSNVYLYARVNLRSAPGNATLLRLRPSTGGGLVTIGVNAKSKLTRKDDVTGVNITSTTILTKGVWHQLQVHALVNGASSTIEVWLDGTKVTTLSGTDNLGTALVGRIQVGNDKSTTMDVVYDDVTADTTFVVGADTVAPTVPQNLRTTLVGSNRVDLAWDPSSDAFGVAGYTVYRNGVPLSPTATGTTFSDTTAAALTSYNYTVDAFDAAGHHSEQSSPPFLVTTTAPDTEKPTKPTGLFASSPYSTRVDLVWNASTDNTSVVGYTIYRLGSFLATVDGTTLQYHDLTVSKGTLYTYTVDAFDAATPSNHSDVSDPSSVTTSNSDPVIGAAGDIACDPADVDFLGGAGTHNDCAAKAVSDLMLPDNLTAVLPLGDEQYECGGATAFTQSYDLSWGRLKAISDPVPGNHEYDSIADTPNGTGCSPVNDAAGYYQYFGTSFGSPGSGDPTHGYYSYDVGAWHIIALNSECANVGGCGLGSPQETWLKSDLAAHPSTGSCTLAYWHRPRFASSVAGNNANFDQFWQDLYAANAYVVLVAHFHAYERFAPQDPSGASDTTRGIREFIVGTGGENWGTFGGTQSNSQVRHTGSFGYLNMTLHPTSYDWTFKTALGASFTDTGTTNCH
jgi:hypothetical protein